MPQRFLRNLAFGKHHQPGGVAVEAMHHKQLVGRVLPLDIISENVVGCLIFMMALCAHRQEAVTFVYHYHIVIFIHKLKPRVTKHHKRAREVHTRFRAWRNRGVKGSSHLSPGHDVAMAQQSLQVGAALIRHSLCHKLKEPARLG